MLKIFKYELEITDFQKVEISGFRKTLKVAEQNGNLCLWCLVQTLDKEIFIMDVYINGTGHEIKHEYFNREKYFDSVVMKNGLVWHVFIY